MNVLNRQQSVFITVTSKNRQTSWRKLQSPCSKPRDALEQITVRVHVKIYGMILIYFIA